MDLKIKNKVAMVAASSKGIGFAIASLLAKEGCLVSICSSNQGNLDRACELCPEISFAQLCDLRDPQALQLWYQKTQEKLGEVSILVTNSGGPLHGRLSKMKTEEWEKGLEDVILGPLELVKLVTPGMIKSQWGRIVHVTSLAAKEPIKDLAIYSTLRAGMLALTRLQSQELGSYGITVNSVLPGHTLTDRQLHLLEKRAELHNISVEEATKCQAEHTAVKRLATPEEVASGVVYLCAQSAAYITGVNLSIDGGALTGLL